MATNGIGDKLFALIVAIDVYLSPDIKNLKGCVRDGEAVQDFLVRNLAVHSPDTRIKFLSNESATREAIITTFRSHLTHNDSIDKQSTILFFYAGHGCRVQAPKDWATDDGTGLTEAICPSDSEMRANRDPVFVIPDRTLGGLIAELWQEKGDNIVVILDSCHSGSGTRVLGEERHFARPTPLPPGIDGDILGWASAGSLSFIPLPFRHSHMGTHVLLAACRQDESALEVPRWTDRTIVRGAFTEALVAELQASPLDQITYNELMTKILLPYQTPQCEGVNKKRVVFRDTHVESNRRFFPLKYLGGTYTVDAGSLLGIVRGTEFDVYGGKPPSNPAALANEACLGSLVAVAVGTASCTVQHIQDHQFDISLPAYLRVTNWNNAEFTFKVFFSTETQVVSGEQLNAEWPVASPAIMTVKSREDADIIVVPDGPGKWNFQRADHFIGTYAGVFPKNPIDADPLLGAEVLDAAAHFHCHLYRALQRPSQLLKDQVTLKMHSVVWSESLGQYKLAGEDLLSQHSHVRLLYDDDTVDQYAFTISNGSNYDLFPYLFYLDPSEYTIQRLYFPASATMHAPLLRSTLDGPSDMSVGYGSDGGLPIDFHLDDDEDEDTCFFVLYVSTTYVNMESILQDSPFRTAAAARLNPGRPFSRVKIAADAKVSGELWQAWTSIMTLTRRV